jgi:hypothetical protein
VGDVTGDGLADVLVAGPTGLEVVDSAKRSAVYRVLPPFPVHAFAWRIKSLGDVNGDGAAEIVVSAPDNPHDIFSEECHFGHVFAFSGKDGTVLWEIPGVAECDYMGYSLACPGDLNGDKVPDLAVGIPGRSFSRPIGGVIAFHDGRTGARFGEASRSDSFSFAYRLEAVGDANGNGFGDLLVRQSYRGAAPRSEVWLVDGGTREFLYEIEIPDPQTDLSPGAWGGNFMGLTDPQDDGFPDFVIGSNGVLVGADFSEIDSLGRLDWFDGAPRGVRSFGKPCSRIPGITPRIGITGSPRFGGEVSLHLTDVEPGQRGLLLVGLSSTKWQGLPLPLDLSFAGIPGCDLLVSPDAVHRATATRAGGNNAAATVRLSLSPPLAMFERPVYAQWILWRGQAGAVTRALELTLQ